MNYNETRVGYMALNEIYNDCIDTLKSQYKSTGNVDLDLLFKQDKLKWKLNGLDNLIDGGKKE